MSVECATLHGVRLQLDARRLMEYGRRKRLPMRNVDTGYLVHCALVDLFGDAAPKPFIVLGSAGRFVQVLGYAEQAEATLRERGLASAARVPSDLCDWSSFAARPLRDEWSAAAIVAFTARVCPVVRVGRGSTRFRPGAEVDAFLARAAASPAEALRREEVYRSWFTDRVAAIGGARVVESRIVGFQLDRLIRRTQGSTRTARVNTRPDVTVSGLLEITDGAAFVSLLRRGVGRHRTFGFGMLMVRGVERP